MYYKCITSFLNDIVYLLCFGTEYQDFLYLRVKMALSVIKMSGTQNTFFILDARCPDFNTQLHQLSGGLTRATIAKNLCHSFHLSKADGCIFIEEDPVLDFKWDFYNSDGSHAQMCGNAARCISWLAYKKEWVSSPFVKFQSVSGVIKADVDLKGFVKVEMSPPQILEKEKVFKYKNQVLKGLSVNTGVPHFVMQVENMTNREYLREIAQHIRKHPCFGNEGSNVSFLRLPHKNMTSQDIFEGLTFERGVEDFTQSCGTGAVAIAAFLISKSIKSFNEDILIKVPGGQLTVSILEDYKSAFLFGAIEYLEQFELKPEFIKALI